MALSDEEQRLLDQMEAALAAEDPKLASALRGTSTSSQRRRAVLAGLGLLVGMGCLIGGMQVHPALSVFGFVVMVASAVLGVTAWQQAALSGAESGTSGKAGHTEATGHREDRWGRPDDTR